MKDHDYTDAVEHSGSLEEYKRKELIDYYVEDLERLAAENEVTVDYYIAEFT